MQVWGSHSQEEICLFRKFICLPLGNQDRYISLGAFPAATNTTESYHHSVIVMICFFFLRDIYLFIYLFIYFWLHWVFVAARGLSLVVVREGLLFVAVRGLLTAVASCCSARALGAWASLVVARGLTSCGSRALERRLSSCGTRA